MLIFNYKPRGFSLIEMLITLILINLVAWMSTQGIVTYFSHRKQYLFMQQLYHDLRWARVESILLNDEVRLQPKEDWCCGWAIIKNTTQHILKEQGRLDDCRIDFSSFPQLAYVQFSPEGASDGQNATFDFYDSNIKTMSIVMNQAGRVRWEGG